MKSFTPLLVVTLLTVAAAPCAYAQEKSADSSAITAKLTQMENDWAKALRNKDHAAVENMVADDFAEFNSKGKHRTKSQLGDEIKNETDTLSSSENDKMDVHVYARNLATVCGTSTETGKDKGGKEFSHSYALGGYLDGAQWQMGVHRRSCRAVPGKEVKLWILTKK
jgi:ketosteroid isomerase-like protein